LNDGGGCSNLGQLERLEIILFNALAFFIRKSKIKATTAIIQTTRLLVKLECFEIILFNAFASVAGVALILDLCMTEAKALNKMILKQSNFTKRATTASI
jgi:hypothetical protein